MKKIYYTLFALILMTASSFTMQAQTSYDGYLNIEMMGQPLAIDSPATVEITENGDGTCTFALPNFSLDLGAGEPTLLGDIIVENVTMTTDDNGTTTYAGSVDGLQLAQGVITANVDINGTITADDVIDFDIDVEWVSGGAGIPISVTFTSSKMASTEYEGYLNIEMKGQPLAIDSPATVEITNNGDGTCTFALPNFSLDLGAGEPTLLGDIIVENVTMTTDDNGTTTYAGSVDGLQLAQGVITANVDINGTITADNEIDFDIDVEWVSGGAGIPISVTFTSEPQNTSSVDNIATDKATVYGSTGAICVNGAEGRAYIYNIAGQLVKSQIVDTNSQIAMPQGIYIVKAGDATTKVIVK